MSIVRKSERLSEPEAETRAAVMQHVYVRDMLVAPTSANYDSINKDVDKVMKVLDGMNDAKLVRKFVKTADRVVSGSIIAAALSIKRMDTLGKAIRALPLVDDARADRVYNTLLSWPPTKNNMALVAAPNLFSQTLMTGEGSLGLWRKKLGYDGENQGLVRMIGTLELQETIDVLRRQVVLESEGLPMEYARVQDDERFTPKLAEELMYLDKEFTNLP